jgi:ABC-type nitrate/sulfonate/bicarbonate transport system ATPase subunit
MGSLSIDNVSLTFESRKADKVVALKDLSMEIPDKQFAVIVGPSGCGKSSLLDLIAGLRDTTGGQCRIDGTTIQRPGSDRGMVFQTYSLFPWLTVERNIEFGPSINGVPKGERKERTAHYVNTVGLSGFENAYPMQLSGGMRQRVAIARALANDPQVLLMDEPFGALDSQTRSIMQQLLLDIWEQEHKTVLFVTHDIDEALYLGDVVYVMSARPGRIMDTIAVDLDRPRDYDIITSSEFIGLKRRIMTSLHGEVERTMAAM